MDETLMVRGKFHLLGVHAIYVYCFECFWELLDFFFGSSFMPSGLAGKEIWFCIQKPLSPTTSWATLAF